MIDPIIVLNSTNTHIPGVVLGTLVPDGADGYQLSVSMEWLYGVSNYILQPILLLQLLIIVMLLVFVCIRVVR